MSTGVTIVLPHFPQWVELKVRSHSRLRNANVEVTRSLHLHKLEDVHFEGPITQKTYLEKSGLKHFQRPRWPLRGLICPTNQQVWLRLDFQERWQSLWRTMQTIRRMRNTLINAFNLPKLGLTSLKVAKLVVGWLWSESITA